MARIIAADDEIHILRAAEFKLKRVGHDVITASDGQEAWELLNEAPADLLITDMQMPRLDGLQLIQRLRASDELADLPAIMLTAKGFELQREKLKSSLNIFDICSKPFSPRMLCELAERAIAESPRSQTQSSTESSAS